MSPPETPLFSFPSLSLPFSTRSPSFCLPSQSPYCRPAMGEPIVQNGFVESFPADHDDVNWRDPDQFHAQAQAGYQAPMYPHLFPENQVGDGMLPWMNQQQSNWLSLNCIPPHGQLLPSRCQELPNPQQHNQVPGMDTSYDPQHHIPMLPEPSLNPRPEHFGHQFVKIPTLPEPFLQLRPPQFGHLLQAQPAQTMLYNSLPHWSGLIFRNQHYPEAGHQINQAAVTTDPVDPRKQPLSSLSNASDSRPQTGQRRGISMLEANTSGGKSIFEIGDGSVFETEDAPTRKRTWLESTAQENRGPPPRLQRVNSIADITSQYRSEWMPSVSNSRPAKNSVYDPLFEGIGLPVDPHLRMFALI